MPGEWCLAGEGVVETGEMLVAQVDRTASTPRLPARDLLRPFGTRDFRLLFTSQLLSELGDWGARLALTVLIYAESDSAGLAGLVLVASFLPWGLFGALLSTLGDRHPRRSLMMACDVFRGGIFLLLTIDLPVAAQIAFVFLASLAAPPYDSARSATMVEIFEEDEPSYGAAGVVTSITVDAGIVVGYAAGGLLLSLTGASTALMINGLTFIASAELTRRLHAGRHVPEGYEGGGRLRVGARAIRRDAILWRAAWIGVTSTSAALGIQALLPILAADEVGADGASVGVLAAVSAVATGLCGFVLPHAGQHRRLLAVQSRVVAFGGLGAAALFLVFDSWPLLLLPVFVAGLVFGALVPAMPVVGTRLPREVRSSSFGVLQGTTLAGQAGAAALATWSADAVGIRPVLVVAALVAGAIGTYGLLFPVPGAHERR